MATNISKMFVGALHKIAAQPWVYDLIQRAAGQRKCIELVRKTVATLPAQTVVDVGGGTGNFREVWPANCRYVCLDLEMPKLLSFRAKVPDGLAVLSDGSRMSLASGSADVVTCIAVTHHLSGALLDRVMDEAFRVLRAGGRIVLFDPVVNRERWIGQMLWRLDRGAYPRTAEELREKLERRFRVTHWERFAVYHEYALGIGTKLAPD